MKKAIPSTAIPTHALKSEALAGMTASFDRFCLAAGIETLSEMMEQDAEAICGSRHARGEGRQADRWGRRKGRIGFHGGKVDVERPRVRGLDGEERILASWKSAVGENWLGEWAMNPTLIAVSTRKFERSVRLPGGDAPAPRGAGLSKSATSRRFVALSAARMRQWMATRLDHLDLMVIQIDGVHMADDSADGGDRRRRDGGKASARPCRGRDGKRRDGASADRQSDRPGARPGRAAPVHHRRIEGAVDGDPAHLRARCADPAPPCPKAATRWSGCRNR